MPVPQGFASASARAEGWDVFDCGVRQDGSACREVKWLDDSSDGVSILDDDGTAWEHVIKQARAGSPLHRSALELVDPVERGSIRFWCSTEDLLS